MSDAPASPSPARIRSRTRRLRLARRRQREAADVRVMTLLTAGVAVDEIAAREGVPLRRMRDRVAAMLARREAEPEPCFVTLQRARLGDAMMVAHAAMMEGDLKALDRVLRIVRELERYHGFRPPEPLPAPPLPPQRLVAPPPPRALPAPDESEASQTGEATKICNASP